MVRERSWQVRVACLGTDVELFYSEQEADIQTALALCARCEVLTACYAQAMVDREAFGVWGGTVAAQRRRVFRIERRRRDTADPTAA